MLAIRLIKGFFLRPVPESRRRARLVAPSTTGRFTVNPERRKFLACGLAAGVGGLSYVGHLGADVISDELQKRLKYLSTPDGIPADAKFGVPFNSPSATPFLDKLFVPPIAQPEIVMTGPEWPKDDGPWWEKFEEYFWKKAAEYRALGINIGGLPVPGAHQQFFTYRPKKFYIMLEREVVRQYHSDYGKVPGCANSFWRSVGGRPIMIPMVTVRKTTQLGHVVDVLDLPSSSGLFQATADQVLGRPLDHPTPD